MLECFLNLPDENELPFALHLQLISTGQQTDQSLFSNASHIQWDTPKDNLDKCNYLHTFLRQKCSGRSAYLRNNFATWYNGITKRLVTAVCILYSRQ
jgi:hypothetical protein